MNYQIINFFVFFFGDYRIFQFIFCEKKTVCLVIMKVTNLSSMSSDVEDNEPIRTRIPPLHKAIRNNEDFIEKLLEYGFVQDINATDNLGFTALHIAVLEKNIKVTETLIKHGANVNVMSNEEKLLPEIDALVDRDDHKTADDPKEGYCNLTPLHIAALSGSKEIVRTLIKHGAYVNCETNNRYRIRPLQCAVESGSLEILSIILESGGECGHNLNGFDYKYLKNFERIICYAAASGKLKILKNLIKNGTMEKRAYDLALFMAAENGYGEIVTLLIQHGANFKYFHQKCRPIHMAALYGHSNVVKILIDNGVDIDELDDDEIGTPLANASFRGSYEVVKLLLQNGAEVDKVHDDDFRFTAFRYAVEEGHFDVAELLIYHGADLHPQDAHLNTPLHFAVYEPHYTLITVLIENGANTELRNDLGNTALEEAMKFEKINTFRKFIYSKHNM